MPDHSHEDLVEQAETVLSTTKASMYDVAGGEAARLQQMLEAADGGRDD